MKILLLLTFKVDKVFQPCKYTDEFSHTCGFFDLEAD
jgi:hypothetical protein